MGSDGMRNNQATQTSAATAQVGQGWLSDPTNADDQSDMLHGVGNKSVLSNKVIGAATTALQKAPANIAKQTTAPMVANFLQSNMGLPKVVQPVQPTKVGMRKA